MKKVKVIAGILALLFVVGGVYAKDKDIRVEGKEQLEVDFKAGSESYKVDEPISFRVKTNKNAYIYVVNVTGQGEDVTLLFPNKYEEANKVKANKEITIPAKSVFKSDREGMEHVVIAATTKKLDLQTKGIKGSKFFGVKRAKFEKIMKDIRVEPVRGEDERAIKELQVTVKGRN